MLYIHHIFISPIKIAYPNESFGDRVVSQIFYELHSVDTTTNRTVVSPRFTLDVPAPDPNNFVPFNSISYADMLAWINASVDVVALQNENISKL
jgi:hypothetical protein